MKLLLAVLFAVLTVAFSLNPLCQKEIDTGPCRAALRRYGYSYKEKRCVKFTYGGCKGNSNNFETMRQCKKTCFGWTWS